MIYIKHAPEETAWSTHALNDCHNGHPQCIDKTMLSSLPAARRATREDKNMIARSFRCIKLEPLHGSVLNFYFSAGYICQYFMYFGFGIGYCQPILGGGCHKTKWCPQNRSIGKYEGIKQGNAYRGDNEALGGPKCNCYGRGGRSKLRPASILAIRMVKKTLPSVIMKFWLQIPPTWQMPSSFRSFMLLDLIILIKRLLQVLNLWTEKHSSTTKWWLTRSTKCFHGTPKFSSSISTWAF